MIKSEVQIDLSHGFRWGLANTLTEDDKYNILAAIKGPLVDQRVGLEGRAGVRRIKLSNGPAVIKEYRRGGWLGRVLGNIHLKFGPGRAESEFALLCLAAREDIKVPTPIAFIESNRLLYEAWLVMEEIPAASSLAECSRQNGENCDSIIDAAAIQIVKLIKARIFHLDLHPGNVLKSGEGKVYLIDFDKARIFRGNLKDLRDLYLCRWRRAVIKHNLPSVLAERMSLALRRVDVWDKSGKENSDS